MSIFNFLFKPNALEIQRRECLSRMQVAALNHEMASVINQATSESLNTTLDINKKVRQSTRAKIEKMTQEHGSGERVSVAKDVGNGSRQCSACVFFRRTTDGCGMCDHTGIMALVADVFFCDYWNKK